jgi:hypothetical protein
VIAERGYLSDRLKVGTYLHIESGLLFETLLPSRIGEGAAIEHESAAVSLPFEGEHMGRKGGLE